MRARAPLAAVACSVLLGAAAPLPPLDDDAAWRFVSLPRKQPTRFEVVQLDGTRALRIEADSAYGNRVHEFAPSAATAAGTLAWQWRVEQRNDLADLKLRHGDDTTLKVCALFDMPTSKVPMMERAVLAAGRAALGEKLPAASVCYVWDAKLERGTTLESAHSRRLRYVIARGPDAPLDRWLDEQHDLAADFKRLFADESPDEVPPLIGIAVGADTDNTRSRSVGYLRALRWAK